MIVAYIACDGNQFDNEEECLNYENKINLINSKAFCLFDKNGTIMHFPPNYDIFNKLEEAYFFICRTEECAEALDSFMEDQGGRSIIPYEIESNVLYGYGINDKEEWKSVSEVLRDNEAQMNKLITLNEKITNQLL